MILQKNIFGNIVALFIPSIIVFFNNFTKGTNFNQIQFVATLNLQSAPANCVWLQKRWLSISRATLSRKKKQYFINRNFRKCPSTSVKINVLFFVKVFFYRVYDRVVLFCSNANQRL